MSVARAEQPVERVRDLPASERVRLTEVFCSLQGESNTAGLPTVFVRLTGCPLRCVYCDTAYAFHGGASEAVDDVVARVAHFGVTHVCVTGGEPLAQRGSPPVSARRPTSFGTTTPPRRPEGGS